ncbi:RNA polymerase sigma factor [Aquibacillus salsiterrae]|uniref:Sigma-70 family RNA polymerase sigma factor n=1 Tax=Aquibacillus salsiterrae TaxID=2950439 RepID=A0A9X3WHH0_9BACI|nr:sigma-70 family RNA polymerase sigma factor [Aquibacillus salsiterrae]MDC3418530.1 sigma-70 family RNA polymerase sigma factor [Aquibacillus salsiterrae]
MDKQKLSVQRLKEIATGSKEAFDDFYVQHLPFVYKIAFQFTSDRLEAEDVCHDVFLEVYQKAHLYRPEKGTVEAWLAVKTKSRSIDKLRKKKTMLIHKLEGLLREEVSDAEVSVLAHIEREVIFEALKHLPEEQQSVIYHAYFKDLTQKQIAQLMGKPLGSIKSMVRYGLNNLRKQKNLLNWSKPSGGENNEL